MKTAVGYCRFSSEKQRDGYSIEAQEDAIKEYCKKNGIKLLKFYVDRAKSAKNADRESFQDMISDAKKHLFDMVIVHKFDRFARRMYDDVIYRELLKEEGIELRSVCEDFDPKNPTSILLIGLIEAKNEFYLANLSEETKKGQYEKVKMGLACSKAPLGYSISPDGHYVVDEATAPIARELFERVADGESMGDIAHSMKVRGIKGKLGAVISHQAIEKIIKNTLYIGTYTYSKEKANIQKRDACEPLVPGDLWAEANAQLKKQEKKPFRKHTVSDYALTGIVRCGKCGGFMRGWSYTDRKGKRHSYYRCINTPHRGCDMPVVQQGQLEDAVFNCLKDYVENRKNFVELANELNERIKERAKEGNVKEARKLVGDLARRRLKLSQAYLNGSMPLDIYTDESRNVEARFAEAKKDLAAAEGPKLPKITPDIIGAFFRFYFEKYKDTERGTLFSMMLQEVIVYDDKITITWKIKSPDASCIAYRELGGLNVARCALQTFMVTISVPVERGFNHFEISRKKDYSCSVTS